MSCQSRNESKLLRLAGDRVRHRPSNPQSPLPHSYTTRTSPRGNNAIHPANAASLG